MWYNGVSSMNIYISGSIGYDEIMDFPGHFKDYFHPEKLHQINVSFAVARLNKHVGGIATNIAYAIAQLNDKSQITNNKSILNFKSQISNSKNTIYPVGAVGKDGQDVLDFFKKNKISTDYIQTISELYTTTGKVITDMNDNQIWGYYYGASSKYAPNFKFQISNLKSSSNNKLQNNTANDFWVLSATHEKPFSAILRHCIANKLPYLFDPGMTLTWIRDDLLKKGVLNATYLVGNDYEMAMIEKRLNITVEDMVKKGVNVITTLGGKGVSYYGSTDSVAALLRPNSAPRESSRDARVSGMPLRPRHLLNLIVSPCKVRKVVDPTGAGDAWRGGFVAGLAQGLPIETCLKLGNVMGSMAVEKVGTVAYTATEEEIEKRLRKIKVITK